MVPPPPNKTTMCPIRNLPLYMDISFTTKQWLQTDSFDLVRRSEKWVHKLLSEALKKEELRGVRNLLCLTGGDPMQL